jgi:PAS domain S-box-containing protein
MLDVARPAPRRILVVDDSAIVRQRIRRLLSDVSGARVVGEAETAADALDAIERLRPDAIILDLRLREGSGLDVLAALRERSPRPLVVVLTNSEDAEYRARCAALGVAQYLDKSRDFDRVPVALGLAPVVPSAAAGRAVQERYEALIEYSTDVITVFDEHTNIVFASPSVTAVLGYRPDEYIGTSVLTLLHPDDVPAIAEAFGQLVAGAPTAAAEARVRHRDGTWRWLAATASNRLEDPRVRGIVLNGRDVTALREALDQARAQRDEYETLVAGASDGIAVIAPDLRVLAANPRYHQITGYAPGELVGRSLLDTVPDSDREAATARVRAVQDGGEALFERPLLRKDGVVIPIEVHARRLPDGRMLALTRDISERRRADRLFRAAVQAARHGLIISDAAGVIQLANQPALTMLGYAPEDVLGTQLDVVLPAVSDTTHAPGVRTVARADGRRITAEIETLPLDTPDGVMMLTTIVDLTDQVQLQQRLRSVSRMTTDGVWEWDAASGRFWWSERAFALFGLPPRDTGPSLEEWRARVHPADRDAALRSYEAWLASGSGEWTAEYRVIRPDGRTVFVADRAVAFRDEAGRLQRVVGSRRDQTEHRELEAQLRQAQKLEAVGRLAGGVAHDFNNILSAIIGYAQLLAEDLPAGTASVEDVGEILRAAGRARDLTRQLLAFSRRQVLNARVLEVNDVVRGVEKMIGRLLGEDVDFALRLAPDAGRVRADAGQLEQVLMNLAVNARDAMPRGGRLTIETRAVTLDATYTRTHESVVPGRYVLITVSDTGEGMTPEVRARLFEPFFTTKEQGKGTGLGLATVYGIVKQSGGWIWVYSEPGLGATFKVYLPLVDEAAAPAAITPAAPVRGNGQTVLLVEDDAAVRRVTGEMLSRWGYTVLSAERGDAALALVAAHGGPIDLLLTDVVMPELSGPQLARVIQGMRPGLKVLFMSGYADAAIVRHGLLDEGAAFIQKPVAPEALARRVREVIDGAA